MVRAGAGRALPGWPAQGGAGDARRIRRLFAVEYGPPCGFEGAADSRHAAARPRGVARFRRRAPARRRARAHRHRLRRHRQDAFLDRALPPPGARVPGRRGLRLARLGHRGGRGAADRGRSRSTSPRRTAARRSTRSAPSSATAACCWCSTISSRCSMPPQDIAALVSRCPALQVIATSRAPLKIGAESEFALPPLALPAADTVAGRAGAEPVGRALRPARREGEARLRAHRRERRRDRRDLPPSRRPAAGARARRGAPCVSSIPPRCCSGSTTRSTC